MTNRFLVSLVAFALISLVQIALGELNVRKPRAADIVGNWLGHDACAGHFVKVAFYTNQTGVATFNVADEAPDAFTFTWELKDFMIVCKGLQGKDPPTELKLTSEGCSIGCTLRWGKARRTYVLVSERRLLEQLDKSNRAIKEAHP